MTGFDNVFIASHLEVPLTTMAQNYDAIGKKAIELLMAMQNRQPVGCSTLWTLHWCSATRWRRPADR